MLHVKDPSDRLRGESGLLRHRLRAVVLMGVLLVAVMAGCGGTVAPHSGTQRAAGVIPWLALRPAPGAAPTPLAVPPGTAACVSSDLAARFTGVEGLTGGQMIGGFVFSDRSGAPCEVSGTPTVHLLGASGARIKVRPGPDLVGDPPSVPVLLMPGLAATATGAARPGQAWLALTWSDLDLAAGGTTCSPTPAVAASVVFEVPDGRVQVPVTVPAAILHSGSIAPCDGVLGVSPFQAVAPNPTLPLLAARLIAPTSVVAGRALRYRVILTNRSKGAVDFANTCATYSEVLGGGAGAESVKIVEEFQLNCAAARTLLPGASITFAMVLDTPKGAPHIRAVLSWGLVPWSGFVIGSLEVSAPVKIR